jgi:hypothetical protein
MPHVARETLYYNQRLFACSHGYPQVWWIDFFVRAIGVAKLD